MTITHHSTRNHVAQLPRMRHVAHSAVIAGLIAIAASTVGSAIAKADWDIEAYDDCVKIGTEELACCRISGGVISNQGVCVAPPARIQSSTLLQQVPAGPRLGPLPQTMPETNTATAPAS